MEQQGIRRRLSHILASSIGLCRSKPSVESPICVTHQPASTHPSPVRKPRLADLFSADSDTTRCNKFESDKTWSGSEGDRASMSHLSPFDYESCEAEFPTDTQERDDKLQVKDYADNAFQADYYRKSFSSSGRPNQHQPVQGGNSTSELVERSLSQSRQIKESVCSNERENDTSNNNASSGNKCSKPPARRTRRGQRRRQWLSEVTAKGRGGSVAVAKRSVDPYEDFKRSMVEMIVEKEIFGREELEELLTSFLGLNSPDHHKIIVLVFVDILQILFSNSSSSFSKCNAP